MENRTCAKCLKNELEQEDSAFFKKGDKVRPMYNFLEAIEPFGQGAARFIWSEGVSTEETFCGQCIVAMCHKSKTVRKGRPKKEKA